MTRSDNFCMILTTLSYEVVMDYTLRQLETFIAIACYGGTSRAARELHMSQPAVSKALTALESQLSCRLFERQGKRLHLNEVGRALLPRAQSLLAEAREIQRSFAGSRPGLIGLLRVGASSTIANYIMPELIGRFVSEQLDVRMSMSVGNTQHVLARLRAYEIDIAMIEGFGHGHDLDTRHWRDDRMVVLAAPDNPLAGTDGVSLDQLVAAPWIMREPGSGTRQNLERSLGDKIGQLNIALELGQTEAVKRAVELGYGVSCLSEMAIRREVDAGRLVELRTPDVQLTRAFYIVVHKTKHRSDLLRAFLDYLMTQHQPADAARPVDVVTRG
ncbi:MAG: LysR family transcriptional regulator [Phycisphaera sp.]|nr:LysR family transcriptional regulator [Phycisphaera sp.]